MIALPFVRYELRRHLPTLGMALLALAIMPVTRRLIADDWRYWDGAWNVWGAVLTLYILMPLLVLAMAASGWARERSLGTLDWLYARPLSSGLLFALRASAIAGAALAWSAIALAVHRVRWVDLEQALSTVAGLPGPITLLAAALALSLGAGLLASAFAASAETAFRTALLLVLASSAAVVAIARLVGPTEVVTALSAAGHSEFLDTAMAGSLLVLASVWIAAAACAGGGVDDPRRRRRATLLAALASVGALAAFGAWLYLPLLAGRESRYAVFLGEGSGLGFAAARGIGGVGEDEDPRISHPVLRSAAGSKVLRSTFAIPISQWFNNGPWASAGSRMALVETYPEDGWVRIDASGGARLIDLRSDGTATGIGWSPSGRHFAWQWTPWFLAGSLARQRAGERVIVADEEGSLRYLPIPRALPPAWRAAWIDEDTLLLAAAVSVAPEESGHGQLDSRDAKPGDEAWAVLEVGGGAAPLERRLPPGHSLAAPALYYWGFGRSALPRLGEAAVVVWSEPPTLDGSRRPVRRRLARLDAATGDLEPGPELPAGTSSFSLGNLRDGALVWAATERPLTPPRWDGGIRTTVWTLASAEAEPRRLCTVPDGRVARFVGQSGPWAVWDSIFFPEYRLWGCNVDTGEAREIEEWRQWAHVLATITDQGLWTPQGWKPIGSGP